MLVLIHMTCGTVVMIDKGGQGRAKVLPKDARANSFCVNGRSGGREVREE